MDELLHIYAQQSWHQPVTIVGNRAALEALRDAIQQALDIGQGVTTSAEVFTNDGEGYEVLIMPCEDKDLWDTFATPYTDPDAQGTNQGRAYPTKSPLS